MSNLNDDWSFSTESGHIEPNSVGVLDRMYSLDDAMNKVQKREEDLRYWQAGTSKDLGLEWIPADSDAEKRGGVFIVHHSDLGKDPVELDKTAIKSACMMMNTKWSFYRQFPDPEQKFVKDFSTFMDHKGNGVVFCTGSARDGLNRRVESIVPSNFDRTSDAQILGAILYRLNQDFAKQVRGVQILQDGENGTFNYRILFGRSMMNEDPSDPTKSVLPMLSFVSSEIGLAESKIALGLYRIYCRNGMMRTDWEGGIAKWKRRNGPNEFIRKAGDVIGNVGHFATGIASTLGPRMNMPLVAPAVEMLMNFAQRSLIGFKHAEAARMASEYSPAHTEYDFLNILTDSAKHLSPISSRQLAESNALRLAMQPNGFSGVYSEGFNKDFSKDQHAILSGLGT